MITEGDYCKCCDYEALRICYKSNILYLILRMSPSLVFSQKLTRRFSPSLHRSGLLRLFVLLSESTAPAVTTGEEYATRSNPTKNEILVILIKQTDAASQNHKTLHMKGWHTVSPKPPISSSRKPRQILFYQVHRERWRFSFRGSYSHNTLIHKIIIEVNLLKRYRRFRIGKLNVPRRLQNVSILPQRGKLQPQ